MKQFLKENINHILFLILIGLVLVFFGRVFVNKFTTENTTQNLNTTQRRVQCAEYFGWEVDASSETEETVYIPETFDDVYKRYNSVQKLSGFNLLTYRGKVVTRYTFRVLNFPGQSGAEAFVNLLVYQGKLIGGDCLTVAIDGLMLPLDRRFVD